MEKREIDDATGTPTTGHDWDGIKELDTPMPRWWLWSFYGCIAFSAVYVVLYPAIPMLSRATDGLLGWSSRGDLTTEMAGAVAATAGLRDQIAASSMDEIIADPELFRFAAGAGHSAFSVNCVQCHGSGAAGSVGYPNLQDDDWIWGGSPEEIRLTIVHGIRSDDPDSRVSEMPAFGRDGILERPAIVDVAAYVMTLSGAKHASGDPETGKTVFAENCAACHGESGEGVKELGAPALNDPIWLRVSDQQGVISQVVNPKHGVMPAWEPRLGPVVVKQLAAYVYSLGGGAALAAADAN
ncbi:cytochrome-c oxidase, cbb3-type subunit III [Aureimonas sp. SA4125]|uniref:cytochrome-c oxidase, cbb3-type subunit III n=1 Tax=Aureimonas sp. SA4125 TaxID=2826993 RepID=UPI001CC39B38|nr:cytochrome-c oxidase, cbb3-type subunit III [Aureimonas sp. SA4125]